jgi:hypothetical protein
MADKEHSDTQEKIELLSYGPGLLDTGDLEAGTHTIVPTARPAIASAQYSSSLALSKPSDARLIVKWVAARLNVNIAGLGTATTVNCSVRVDVDDIDLVQLWEAVGSCITTWYLGGNCLELSHVGLLTYFVIPSVLGSGTVTTCPGVEFPLYTYQRTSGYPNEPIPIATHLVNGIMGIAIAGSVATDLNYILGIKSILRSAQ